MASSSFSGPTLADFWVTNPQKNSERETLTRGRTDYFTTILADRAATVRLKIISWLLGLLIYRFPFRSPFQQQ